MIETTENMLNKLKIKPRLIRELILHEHLERRSKEYSLKNCLNRLVIYLSLL